MNSRSRLRVAGSFLVSTLLLASPSVSPGQQRDLCAGHGLSSPARLAPREKVAELARLVDRRLSYMDDVAAYKWVKGLPIEDLERERVVMANSLQSAARLDLEPISVRPFFEQQILLAKSIQAGWFERWENTSFQVRQVPDLPGAIRPKLLELGDEILAAVADLAPWQLPRPCLEELAPVFLDGVATESVSAAQKLRLFRSIGTIRPLESKPDALAHPDDLRIPLTPPGVVRGALARMHQTALGPPVQGPAVLP